VRPLHPKPPELLLECARDRDEEVLRNRVVAGNDFDARSRAGRDFGHTVGDLPDHVVVPEMAGWERRDLTEARDGRGLAVGHGTERNPALGHLVAKGSPRVDELIELEVQERK
jgi:hypothetical protein